jgi:hypothetical protein
MDCERDAQTVELGARREQRFALREGDEASVTHGSRRTLSASQARSRSSSASVAAKGDAAARCCARRRHKAAEPTTM